MAQQSPQKAAIHGALTGRGGDGKWTKDEEEKEGGIDVHVSKTPASQKAEDAEEVREQKGKP